MPLDNFKIPKRENSDFPPVPEDIYQVEIFDIEATQKPAYKKPDVMETVLKFQFTILDQAEFTSKDGKVNQLRGRNIWRDYVPAALWSSTKNGKNLLWQIIEATIMRELTEDEINSMDSYYLNKLIGFQCRIVIKNSKGEDGKIWNNIDSFLPKKGSLPRLTDEEREKARVKVKDGQPVTDAHLAQNNTSTISDDEIPTINLDEEDEMDTTAEVPAEEKPKVEDVPF